MGTRKREGSRKGKERQSELRSELETTEAESRQCESMAKTYPIPNVELSEKGKKGIDASQRRRTAGTAVPQVAGSCQFLRPDSVQGQPVRGFGSGPTGENTEASSDGCHTKKAGVGAEVIAGEVGTMSTAAGSV